MPRSKKSKSDKSSNISESTLGDYKNDPDALNLTTPQQNGCSCEHVVRRLQENVEILTDKVRKLEATKKCLLSEEEKVLMCKKNMLQLLDKMDNRYDDDSIEDDVILFLKALSAGERCVNIRIVYKISDHRHENLQMPGTDENIVTVFEHPVSINGWSVQFQSELDLEFQANNKETFNNGILTEEHISYCMILTTPEKKKLQFIAQDNSDMSNDRKDYKIVSLPTSRNYDEINTRGLKIFRNEIFYNETGTLTTLTNEWENGGQVRYITWTVINTEN
ncbi:unnamed protein product [Oikopleura dioica]|uniref:Uncharacterized protein n=1 Tax=Oikopleura dioica TaxID=34765 RepID=E4X5E3_OIKDI|nr:unnamed protein product [Oikopleura dioica]